MENESEARVNHPAYYIDNAPVVKSHNGEIPLECIDVIRDMPTWKGNAIKYLWRAGQKKENGLTETEKEIEDLKKSIWYINDRIKQLEYEREKGNSKTSK